MMNKIRWLSLVGIGLTAVVVAGCSSATKEVSTQPTAEGTQAARSVILLIGDGMGNAQRTAGRLYSVGRDGGLSMDSLPVTGLLHTWSASSLVTDSAAAGTALATGVKTNNNAVGVDPSGSPQPSILELAKIAGKSTGLITTTYSADATPASFAAHNVDRHNYNDIALDIFNHSVDVLLGGGETYFLPAGTAGCYPADGARTDGRNLIQEAVANGYKAVCTAADFNAVDPSTTDRLIGTFADTDMTRPYAPDLAAMTDKALSILDKNSNGFFLMVEGGQIDVAAHVNDAVDALSDVVGFDQAVQVAFEYQQQHPDTLVIVAADHATGGLAIEDAAQDGPCPEVNPNDPRECRTLLWEDGPFSENKGGEFWIDWTTNNHTADDVPVSATGPGSTDLEGNHENTDVFQVMRKALGLADSTS
jgi:alkaline phosphatase